jgi:hypothetical protein
MPAKRKSNPKVRVDISECGSCCGGHGYGHWYSGSCGGGVYGLGFIGAAAYYIQTATGFWAGVVGVLKAIVWPAFLVHKLLGL